MGDLLLFLLPLLFLAAKIIFFAGRERAILMVFVFAVVGLFFFATSMGQGGHCNGGLTPWWYPSIAGDSSDGETPCSAELLAPVGVEAAVHESMMIHVGEAVRVMSIAGMQVESLEDVYRSLQLVPRGAIVKVALAYAGQRVTIPYYKTESGSDFLNRFGLRPCTWPILNPHNLMLSSVANVNGASACSFLVFRQQPRSPRMLGLSGVSELVSAHGYRGHVVMGFVYGIRRGAGWGPDLARGVVGALWRMGGGGRPCNVSWKLLSSQWNKPWYLLPLKKFWDPFFLLFKAGCLLMALSVAIAMSFAAPRLVKSSSIIVFRIQMIFALALALFMVLNDTWLAIVI